ncbi:hypothetical protein ACLOJK_039857 [Asimina triloba]
MDLTHGRKHFEVLRHLASIDLIELCNEAKVEHCRATRDLRCCGRYVQHVLNSCGHSSLCLECSPRCDQCPICRIPIPKNGNRLRLRLYNECIEAGLISKRCDDRFQEKADDGKQLMADVQRLYSLFDVALENNLVSLVLKTATAQSACMLAALCPAMRGPCNSGIWLSSDDVLNVLYFGCSCGSSAIIMLIALAFLGDNVDDNVDSVRLILCTFPCSLVFQYILHSLMNSSDVTDVCMDESAVSSDPGIITLQKDIFLTSTIDALGVEDMKLKLGLLRKCVMQLAGISSVIDVLESAFKGTLSPQLQDLHHLSENVLKAKQHLEMMSWCIRHQFLENVPSHYRSFISWRSVVRDRKLAAVTRSWPNFTMDSAEPAVHDGSTLFIEDALSNLGIEQEDGKGMENDMEIKTLQKGGAYPSLFRSKIEGSQGCYPFENLRAAIDILFLRGSSDLVIAKQAIFLYYLFDRHWTMPDEQWRNLVDDFAATFGIARHSLLESLNFYLLDDETEQALQEACRLLPEIASAATHPKIAQVLLERGKPDAALMVLRCSGRDGLSPYANLENGGSEIIALSEAVTAVRVRIECGLLTEAFMYQRIHCSKVKEDKWKQRASWDISDKSKSEYDDVFMTRMEVLVTEICYLCIRRNLVDRMIELPWNSYEEKYIHKCLFENACEDPATNSGSLLVVFYLQRYRYIEAYHVDRKLRSLEDFASKTLSEDVAFRIISASQWRAGLVVTSPLARIPNLPLSWQGEMGERKEGGLLGLGSSTAMEIAGEGDWEFWQDGELSRLGAEKLSALLPEILKSLLLVNFPFSPRLPTRTCFLTFRMMPAFSTARWAGQMDKGIELLPEVLQKQLKTGNLPEHLSPKEFELPSRADTSGIHRQQESSPSNLPLTSVNSSLLLGADLTPLITKKGSSPDIHSRARGPASVPRLELTNFRAPSILHGRLLTSLGGLSSHHRINSPAIDRFAHSPQNEDMSSSNHNLARDPKHQTGVRQDFQFDGGSVMPGGILFGPQATPLKELNQSATRTLINNTLDEAEKVSYRKETNGSINQVENAHPTYIRRSAAGDHDDPANVPSSNHFVNHHAHDLSPSVSEKRILPNKAWALGSSDDPFDCTRRLSMVCDNLLSGAIGKRDSSAGEINTTNGRPRWRSDGASDDEGDSYPELIMDGAPEDEEAGSTVDEVENRAERQSAAQCRFLSWAFFPVMKELVIVPHNF